MGEEESADLAEDLSTLLSSTTLVVLGSLLGAGSKLIERVIIGNVLDRAAFGRVSVGISILTIGMTVALVGFKTGIPRYMSRFESDADKRGAWLTGLVVAGVASTLVTLLLLSNLQRLPELLGGAEPSTALLLPFVIAIPFLAGLEIAVSAIRGHENTVYRTYAYDLFYNLVRLGLLIALLLAGVGAIAAGYAYLIAAAAAAILGHVLLNRLLSLRGTVEFHVREMLLFSIPLVISASVTVLLSQIDTLMLASSVPAGRVGDYNAAYTLSGGLSVVLSAFGFLYLPLTSRLDADARRADVDRVYKLTTKWIYVVAFPAFLVLLAFPGDAIGAVLPGYGGGLALAVLTTGFFVSAAYGRCQATLSAFGYTNQILVINLIAAVLNVGLNLALIPTYGVVGAAIASALSYAGLNGLAFAVLWYATGISPLSARTARTFVVLPVVLLPPSFLLSQVTLSRVALVGVAVLATLATVVVVALTGCLQPEDEIPLDLVERKLGVHVPYIRRYIPDEE